MENLLRTLQSISQRCVRCGACQAVCPVYTEILDEAHVARGRMALIAAHLAGEIEEPETLRKILSTCIGCKACTSHCPSGAEADFAILIEKAKLVRESGFPLHERFLSRQVFLKPKILSTVTRLLNIFDRRIYIPLSQRRFIRHALPYIRNGRERKIPEIPPYSFHDRLPHVATSPKTGERVAFFYGCAVNHLFPRWGEDLLHILTSRNIDVIVPDGQVCCGSPALAMGDFETAKMMIQTNLSVFNAPEIQTVITLCATCGSTLRNLYPRLSDSGEAHALSNKIIDLQEFLAQRNLLPRTTPHDLSCRKIRVTYHDPCHLNHGMGVREAPRRILQNLPGIEYIEMRDADRCCGGGGLFSITHYDLSLKIGRRKVERILESGADVVATACPSCHIHLEDLLRREGSPIRVVHICELFH